METESSSHILVVDDHREIRELLAQYLKQHGFRVTVADGGAAMKKVLRESAIDLVVLDILMPGEDGLSLCRSLREKTPFQAKVFARKNFCLKACYYVDGYGGSDGSRYWTGNWGG